MVWDFHDKDLESLGLEIFYFCSSKVHCLKIFKEKIFYLGVVKNKQNHIKIWIYNKYNEWMKKYRKNLQIFSNCTHGLREVCFKIFEYLESVKMDILGVGITL